MHSSIEERLHHPPDFRVKYRFYSVAEGGRENLPYQGYRSDFWYEHKDNSWTKIFIIWPEFENSHGEVIFENEKPVPSTGSAKMWIITPQMREYHRNKIGIGTKGFFMEGGRKVAECEVIEIIGLEKNPIE
jgi:hypothetical protein